MPSPVPGGLQPYLAGPHVGRAGRPKIVTECTFPLTGRGVVTRVYTDLAVFHIVDGEMLLTECAPGLTPGEIRGQTAAPYADVLGAQV